MLSFYQSHIRDLFNPLYINPLLKSWDGRVFEKSLKYIDGKRWILKDLASPAEQLREILASRIGAGIVNIAQVISAENFPYLQGTTPNSVLSRLAYDYSVKSLPLQDLDSATAGELVFSTLIRRRDAHEFNRGYVNKIPVFFDHHVSFDGEEMGAENITAFFSRNDDAGCAGRWRCQRVTSLSQLSKRFRNIEWGARHFCQSESQVRKQAFKIAKLLVRRLEDIEDLSSDLQQDMTELKRILKLTRLTQTTAFDDIEYMLDRVFSSQNDLSLTGYIFDNEVQDTKRIAAKTLNWGIIRNVPIFHYTRSLFSQI